jgi:serine/threonine protein kinase
VTIATGTRLGPYEILSPLGAGGMGEVYRARDTRLDRIVARKVLPDHLASHPELRQRFECEARAVSSLNHPHICTLHDIGQQDGLDYLVMELIEGESLADRLIKGPLPADEPEASSNNPVERRAQLVRRTKAVKRARPLKNSSPRI